MLNKDFKTWAKHALVCGAHGPQSGHLTQSQTA